MDSMDGRDLGRAHEAAARKPARERILETAYGLFARRGVRDVGIDEIITHSGVAKATFYRHFPSKEALVLAYMDRWYQVRHDAIEEAIAHAHTPDDALLAAFNVLDDWFSRGAAEVNTFLHVVIEFGPAQLPWATSPRSASVSQPSPRPRPSRTPRDSPGHSTS